MNQTPSKPAGRLELHATPLALQAIEELLELASPETLRAVCDRIWTPDDTRAAANLHALGRTRLAPLNWPDVQRHLDSLTGPPPHRPRGKVPKAVTSRLVLTLAQLAWRLSSDILIRADLARQTGNRSGCTGRASLLPDDEDRSDLADLALAFVTCALVSDAIRDSRVSLRQDTSKPWFESSNSKVLWAIYQSGAGPSLNAGAAQNKAKAAGSSVPRILGRGSPGMVHVRQYDPAVRLALAQSVIGVVLGWCPPHVDALSISQVQERALHWSDAVLIQVDVWLGSSERKAHGRDDTPW